MFNKKPANLSVQVPGYRCLLCILVVYLTATTASWAEPTETRPNVLLVFVDDLKPMTHDYGHEHMHTPNFTRLAKSGVRFENAYCQVPTCGASRASLMTSLYPTQDRFPDFQTKAEDDAPNHPTLPQVFKQNGYHTISNGKIFHHHKDTAERSWSEEPWKPKLNGRSHYNPETAAHIKSQTASRRKKVIPMFEKGVVKPIDTSDGLVAAKTIADLERFAESSKPFFVACGFAKPHMPFYSPVESYQHYPLKSIPLPLNRQSTKPGLQGIREATEHLSYLPAAHDFSRVLKINSDAYHRHMRQGYYASVTHADFLFGKIWNRLRELGLAKNTIVIVLGDHGFMLGEHNKWAKNRLLPDALRTAMWMSGPGIATNQSIESFIEFVDIYPTLCEMVGIDIGQQIVHGKSFLPTLEDPKRSHRDNAYTRFETGDSLINSDYYYAAYGTGDAQQHLLLDRRKDPLAKVNHGDSEQYREVRTHLHNLMTERIKKARAAEFFEKPE